MIRVATIALAAAVLFVATDLYGQDRPNFAGQWTVIVDPDAPPPTRGVAGRAGGGRVAGGGMMGLGQAMTIAQDAQTLTITRAVQDRQIQMVYNLDGSQRRNTMALGNQEIVQTSTARWEGAKFIITTAMDRGGQATQTTMALSLDQAGNLVVETTNPGRAGGAPTTVTTRYQRSR